MMLHRSHDLHLVPHSLPPSFAAKYHKLNRRLYIISLKVSYIKFCFTGVTFNTHVPDGSLHLSTFS
jgi:hypothetical protein